MLKDLWARRDKTALYLIPPQKYHLQHLFGSRLPQVEIIDWRERFLQDLAPSQRYLNLSVKGELDRIRKIGNTKEKAFCLINNEYFLAYLSTKQRRQFWQGLWNDFPYLEGVIVFTVLDSPEILPDKIDLRRWKKQGRLFSSENIFTESKDDEN
jgi:hypothetical protein